MSNKIFIRKKANSTCIKEELTKLSLNMDTKGDLTQSRKNVAASKTISTV